MIVPTFSFNRCFMLISQTSQFPADYLYCRHYLSGLSSRYKLHLAAEPFNSRSIQRIYQLFQRLFPAKPVINNHMKTLNKSRYFTRNTSLMPSLFVKSRGHKKLTASLPDINFVIAVTTVVATFEQNICPVACPNSGFVLPSCHV